MKAAKKRYHKKIPAFWQVLKQENKPIDNFWLSGGLYPGQMSIFCVGRSTGKSMLVFSVLKNRFYLNEANKKA